MKAIGMKAIIDIAYGDDPREKVAMLGCGVSESVARRSANYWVNFKNGRLRDSGAEYADGTLVDCTPALSRVLYVGCADGDSTTTFNWAISTLFVGEDGRLDARYYSRDAYMEARAEEAAKNVACWCSEDDTHDVRAHAKKGISCG